MENLLEASPPSSKPAESKTSFKPLRTHGKGDCAFHALLGAWNPVKRKVFCPDDIKARREELRVAVVNARKDAEILQYASEGIAAWAIENQGGGGQAMRALRERHQAFRAKNFDEAQHLREQFLAALERDATIMAHITRHGNAGESLHNQFHALMNGRGQASDTLINLLMQQPALHQAWNVYQAESDRPFNWQAAENLNPAVLAEYADMVGSPREWLRASEIAIMARAFKRTVIYYSNPGAQPQELNAEQEQRVVIQFNGRDHFEQMVTLDEYAKLVPKTDAKLDAADAKALNQSATGTSETQAAIKKTIKKKKIKKTKGVNYDRSPNMIPFTAEVKNCFSTQLTYKDPKFAKLYERLKPYIEFLNKCAIGEEARTDEEILNTLDDIINETADCLQHAEGNTLYIACQLAMYFIKNGQIKKETFALLHTKTQPQKYLFKIKKRYESLNKAHITPESAWHYARSINNLFRYHVVLTPHTTEESIQNYLNCLEIIGNNQAYQNHKKLIVHYFYRLFETGEIYPKIEYYQRLDELFQPLSLTNFSKMCVDHRFLYIYNQKIVNKEYFERKREFVKIAYETRLDQLEQCIPVRDIIPAELRLFGNGGKFAIQTTFSRFEIISFVHHLLPEEPLFYPYIFDLSDEPILNERLNLELKRFLRSEGYLNSEGHVKLSLFFPLTKTGKRELSIKNFNKLKDRTYQYLYENREKFDAKKRMPLKEIYRKDPANIGKFKQNAEEYFSSKKLLDGFFTRNSLLLFLHCLISSPYGLSPVKLSSVREAIKTCLDILNEADKSSKESHLKKHEEWFKIAGHIVKYLLRHKKSLLINTATPIKVGKEQTGHSFYIVLKYLKDDNIQVVIINGGDGVSKFHEKLKKAKNERASYYYAAFEPFSLQKPIFSDALQHYLYRVISMRYETSAYDDLNEERDKKEDEQANIYTFSKLLRNLYLRFKNEKEEYFYGYGQHKIELLKRDDLGKCFVSQHTGNCSVHNLELALAIQFELDTFAFGELQDNLFLGADELISNHVKLKSEKTKKEEKLSSDQLEQSECLEIREASAENFDITISEPADSKQQFYRTLPQNSARHMTLGFIQSNPKSTRRIYLEDADVTENPVCECAPG